jgi:hypothetical protein
LRVIELAFGDVFTAEKLVDAIQGICAYVLDEFFEVLVILESEFAGVGVDESDEGGGGLGEEVVELLEVLMHFGDCLDHILYIIQINDYDEQRRRNCFGSCGGFRREINN